MKIWKIAGRNIKRNKRRSILSGLAIAIAALSFFMLTSILEGMKEDMAYNLKTFYSGEVRIRNTDYDKNEQIMPISMDIPDPEAVLAILKETEGILIYSERVNFPAVIYREDSDFKTLAMGVDIEKEDAFMRLKDLVQKGAIPDPLKREALIGSGLAKKMGVSIGDKITALSKTKNRSTNAFTFTVSGIITTPVSGLNNTMMIVPMAAAQRFLKMRGGITEILIKLKPGVNPEDAAASINASLTKTGADNIQARSWTKIPGSYSFIQMAQIAYAVIALILFILGSTVIVNTTMMVIYERMREIGTISAMGMYQGEIVRLFFLEAFFISLLGSLAGILVGAVFTYPMTRFGIDFSAAMEGLSFEISPILFPVMKLGNAVYVFVYSIAVASIASLFPSTRAIRIEPVEALRYI